MYDFVPVCETPSGHCLKSSVQLCDIKPPQFPAWFNSEKKLMLMNSCPSWKAYEENCKGGFDSLPWWVALIVLTFLFIAGLVIFLLYKKKRLKWASRVSDVSLQAKQICCKHTVETHQTGIKDKDPNCPKSHGDKAQEIKDSVTRNPVDNSGSPVPATEPYYYVLEEPNSVIITKNSPPELGTFGRRVTPPTPPPPYRTHLPPLNCINNNGQLNHGKPAVMFYPSGKVQVAEDTTRESTGVEKRKKKKKGKSKHSSAQLSSTSNIDDKYMYAD